MNTSRAVWPSGWVMGASLFGAARRRSGRGGRSRGFRRRTPALPGARAGHAPVCGAARPAPVGFGAGRGSAAGMAIADEVQRLSRPGAGGPAHQEREYTNGAERPLAGDLGAMGVYLGLVSAAGRGGASGRNCPSGSRSGTPSC